MLQQKVRVALVRMVARAMLPTALALPAVGQATNRVSVATGGAQGNGSSYYPSISPDGRYVAFQSGANDLVVGDTNGATDVFVRDRLGAGTTERVSLDSGAAQGNGGSGYPSISASGRYVAFVSMASNLVGDDTNASTDVFVHDRQAGTTERVSVDSAGIQGNSHGYSPSISAYGRYVAFHSFASNLVDGDTNVAQDVFVRDRLSGTIERVSVDSTGAQGNGESVAPSFSADGRWVAFHSSASNLAGGDTNAADDVFVHDRQSGATERASVDSAGVQGNGPSGSPALSADGRWVAFHSSASNLAGGDTNAADDVFVHDRQSGVTERASVDSAGVQGNGPSGSPALSADGRYVAYRSSASNLAGADTNGTDDAFVRDREGSVTERASVDTGGAQGNGASGVIGLSISGDGRYVGYQSLATNLDAGDTNARADIFVRDRRPQFSAFCFGDGLDTSHSTPCPCGNTGTAGNGCANSADVGGANLAPSGTTLADDVRLLASRMPSSSSCIYLQGNALDDVTFGDGVRCIGGDIIRLRVRFNVAGASMFPDSTDTTTLSARGGVAPFSGLVRFYQTYYRNAAPAFCPPETFNVTNGVVVDW